MKAPHLLAAAIAALALTATPAAAQVRDLPAAVARTIVQNPEAPLAGPATGDVVVVEYLDYNCPYCKKMHGELQALLKADPKARVLYKQWPVFGDVSVYAAKVALAARWQGKYLAVHDAFMTSPSRLDSRETVRRLARGAGVDMARLDKDLSARGAEIDKALSRVDQEAQLLQLRGTPALIVGSTFVPGGLPSAMLQRLIAQARTDRAAAAR